MNLFGSFLFVIFVIPKLQCKNLFIFSFSFSPFLSFTSHKLSAPLSNSFRLPDLNQLLLFLLPSTAIHHMKLSRTHVDWHSVEEVYLYSDATTSKIARTVTQKLGFSKGLYLFHHTLSSEMNTT